MRQHNKHVGERIGGHATRMALACGAGAALGSGGSDAQCAGGVSSFGYAGTIAHALLERAAPADRRCAALQRASSAAAPPSVRAVRRYAWCEAAHPLL